MMNDPIVQLWQSANSDATGYPVAELKARAHRFHRRIAWRDAREYAAALLVAIVFAYFAYRAGDARMTAACVLIIAGQVYVALGLWRRRVRAMPDDLGSSSLAFHRAQLVRQRDALHDVWRWYLAPLVPGLIAFTAVIALKVSVPLGPLLGIVGVLPSVAIVVAIFYGIHRLNRRAARHLQVEIDDIDRQADPEYS